MPKKFNKLPSQEYLKECLNYDPQTGIFTWKERPISHFKNQYVWNRTNKQRAGNIAGYTPSSGYLMIGIDSTRYRAHRIAWKIVTGNDPDHEIDHVDIDRGNCKFNNLRSAEQKENARNRKEYRNNQSGYKGVSLLTDRNTYRSEIMKDGIRYVLGYFNNPKDAHDAYCKKAKELHCAFAHD